MTTTIDFLKTLFRDTTGPIYICSFSNERDDPTQATERHVITRKPIEIDAFAKKWDKPGRGLFFCLASMKPGIQRRSKDGVEQSIGLFADIDFNKIDGLGSDPRADVLQKLGRLRILPSATVSSGGGVHAYWLFKEPIDTQLERERIEIALRQLSDIVAGDLAVCEVSRVLRLPGSHNTKDGAWNEVEITSFDPDRRYELDDLEEWFSEQSPVMLRKERQRGATVREIDDDPFLSFAKQYGYKPPIDVEERLKNMIYMGSGDSSIHETQIQCGASMLNRGMEIDQVVAILLEATKVAAGGYGARWNWRIEERNIRKDCESWIKKHPPEEKKDKPKFESISGGKRPDDQQDEQEQQQEQQEQVKAASGGSGKSASSDGDNVIDMAERRASKAKDVPALVVGGVINAVRKDGRDIMLTEGEVWIYEDGIWHIMSPAEEQWLRALIHTGFDRLGQPKKTSALNNCWKLLVEHPELFKRKVEWSDARVIVCGNGVLDIDTSEFSPHGPQWFARRKITTDYVAGAECPKFLTLLRSMFELHASPEAALQMYREWLGAALAVPRLTREQRKALLVVGKSRSGKTELSSCARELIGEPVASPAVSEISETFGMQNFIGKSAWIRDDAINEGDRLDPQRFKIIVTGEPIAIRRMAQNALETRMQIPVLLTANSLPRARDASDAVYNRSIVLRLDRVISEEEAVAKRAELGVTPGLSIGAYIMQTEAPGVLNWALGGLRTLLQRGSFDVPDSVNDDIREFKEGNNPVAEFARTAMIRSGNSMIERADILCAYHGWLREEEGEEARASGARWFFPKLRQVIEGMGDHRNGRLATRYLTGVALTDEGLRFWHTHRTGSQLKGGSSGFSTTTLEVNRPWNGTGHAASDDDGAPF